MIIRLVLVLVISLFLVSAVYAQTEEFGPTRYDEDVSEESGQSEASGVDVFSSTEEVSQVPAEDPSLRSLLVEAEAEEGKGNLLKARELFRNLLQLETSRERQRAIRKKIEDINMRILFSPIKTPNSIVYEVKPGDNLYNLAKQFDTTVGFIKRSNGLKNDLIRVGDKLKIVQTDFAIEVDCTQNLLFLKEGNEIVKTYNIASGEGELTPRGKFKIVNKLVDPTWFSSGAIVPPDSPDNILGTRWMGISVPGYGIHGTTEPETIGQSITSGCIRMHNGDVEELYSIVPVGTEVVIKG